MGTTPEGDQASGGDEKVRVHRKLAKWACFTVGMILAAFASDLIVAALSPRSFRWSDLFDGGELFLVSIGLLVGAAADLLFDRLLEDGGKLYHGLLLASCLLVTLPIAVAYGSVKNSGTYPDHTAAAPETSDAVLPLSLLVLVGALALSGVSVALSEKGARDGDRQR